MNYEKKYKEMKARILEIGRGCAKDVDYSKPRQIAEYIDPELKESEEERINRAIFKALSKKDARDVLLAEGIQVSDALAYIEKQGEQRPKQDWSKEDIDMIQDAIHWIQEFQQSDKCKDENDMQNSVTCENWLESLKDRVQPKQKWSEEDSRILYNVKAFIGYAAGQRGVKDELFKEANEWLNSLPIGFIHNENYNEDMVTLLIDELKQIANDNNAPEQYQAEINWLKSLRPKKHCKPSEYDISLLEELARNIRNNVRPFCSEVSSLEDLIENLKNL